MTRSEALDQHIGRAHLRQQGLAALITAEIQTDQLFSFIEIAEKTTGSPRGTVLFPQVHQPGAVSRAGRFDLDDLRSPFHEVPGGQRTRQQLGEVQYRDASQRTRRRRIGAHVNTPSRSHLVATHLSPAVTGAPACSVSVTGCGRS